MNVLPEGKPTTEDFERKPPERDVKIAMAADITFDEISGQANIVLGRAKLAFARLRHDNPFLARLAVARDLLILRANLALLAKNVSSANAATVSSDLAQEYLENHRAMRPLLLQLFESLKNEGNQFQRAITPKMEAAWDEIEDFAETLRLSQSQELLKTLDRVASSIIQPPKASAHDWRDMIAKL